MPLRRLAATLLSAALALASPALAEAPVPPAEPTEAPPSAADLFETLRIADMIAVLRDEGLDYGDELEEQLFPGAGGARWDRMVGLIYDRPTMEARFRAAFLDALGEDPAVTGPVGAFFGAPLGQRVIGLELAARRALLDTAAEEAARVAVEDMRERRDPRLAALERFAAANDLVEENVSGALNANLAFYRGMADGGAFGAPGMTEEEMLSEIWSQEEAVRAEAESWLYPYLMLAYEPLSDDEFDRYIAFSESPAGHAMNRALFEAFNALFGTISHDLGRAAAGVLAGQDI